MASGRITSTGLPATSSEPTTSRISLRRSIRSPVNESCLGLGTEFRSDKIPRNRLGMVSVIPRKKALIPRHSEFRGRAISEARNGTERNGIPRKKLVLRNSSKIIQQNDLSVHQKSTFLTLFLKYSAVAFCSKWVSLRNGIPRDCFYFLLHEKEFRVLFSSAECPNGIPRVCFSTPVTQLIERYFLTI
jgi:hypothetical protein